MKLRSGLTLEGIYSMYCLELFQELEVVVEQAGVAFTLAIRQRPLLPLPQHLLTTQHQHRLTRVTMSRLSTSLQVQCVRMN